MPAADEDTSETNAHDQGPARILELLDRLAGGQQLVDAPSAMGLSEEDARSIFAKAGLIVRQNIEREQSRKRWPVKGSLLDWRDMTVAEALEMLGDLAIPRDMEQPGG